MGQHDSWKDAPDGPRHCDDHGIDGFRGVSFHPWPKTIVSVIDSKDNLIWFLWFDWLNVKIVEVMVYLCWDLCSHHKETVWWEDKNPVVRLVIAFLKFDRAFKQYFHMFSKGLADPLRGILVICWRPSTHFVSLFRAFSSKEATCPVYISPSWSLEATFSLNILKEQENCVLFEQFIFPTGSELLLSMPAHAHTQCWCLTSSQYRHLGARLLGPTRQRHKVSLSKAQTYSHPLA